MYSNNIYLFLRNERHDGTLAVDKYANLGMLKLKRINVLVMASFRSGSTFISEIFIRNPLAFYIFEPGYVLHDKKCLLPMSKYTMSSQRINMLYDIYSCNFTTPTTNCYEYVNIEQFQAHWIINERYQQKTKYIDMTHVTEFCMNHPITAIKTIRVDRLSELVPLIKDPQIQLKVLHLIRDPRGKFSSMENIRKQNSVNQLIQKLDDYCSRWVENMAIGRTMGEWLLGNYRAIRYEDFAENPINKSRKLYKFLGLDLPATVIDWLNNNTKINKGNNPYSTSRDSIKTAHAWKYRLPFNIARQIETLDSCRDLMNFAGYTLSKDEHEFQNKSVSYLKSRLDWFM
ncbi:carbohydrate sulfotransferase 1-like [Saccoglossus kowalevskii]|uniref:Carbohydrate sulfotransferase 1-like n=1 Tax=Saccoglossus kowalevskii TaxID=10224 RepID=A0ABM0H102_SACKO|nr:PREDICTED: carbohydrate sulfotransferase 1-like [Saccoglossus kowalevskii]